MLDSPHLPKYLKFLKLLFSHTTTVIEGLGLHNGRSSVIRDVFLPGHIEVMSSVKGFSGEIWAFNGILSKLFYFEVLHHLNTTPEHCGKSYRVKAVARVGLRVVVMFEAFAHADTELKMQTK